MSLWYCGSEKILSSSIGKGNGSASAGGVDGDDNGTNGVNYCQSYEVMIYDGGGDNILARLLPGAGLVHALAVHVVVRATRLVVLNIFVWK